MLEWLDAELPMQGVLAAAHGVANGDTEFGQPLRIDAEVLAKPWRRVALSRLHPLHKLTSPAGAVAPAPAQTSCFDTAFTTPGSAAAPGLR